jgi:formate hydrogenlyase subunit 4
VVVEREVAMEEEVVEGITVEVVGVMAALVEADQAIQLEQFCRVNQVGSLETGWLE